MIFNMIYGGGTSVNLSVVACQTTSDLPEASSENTIAVITETPVGVYILKSSAPSTRGDGSALVAGDVWISNGGTSNGIEILDDNSIKQYIGVVKQYNGASWENKIAFLFVNGVWKQVSFLGLSVVQNAADYPNSAWIGNDGETGLWDETYFPELYCHQGRNYTNRGNRVLTIPIDVSSYSTMTVVYRTTSSNEIVDFRAGVGPTTMATDYKISASDFTASTRVTDESKNQESTFTVDVSSVTGLCCVALKYSGDYSDDTVYYCDFIISSIEFSV